MKDISKIIEELKRDRCNGKSDLDFVVDILYLMHMEIKSQEERIEDLETKICETNMRG
jgi:hypothetical protein